VLPPVGASVKITSDVNDAVIDIKDEKPTVTDTELRIAFNAISARRQALLRSVRKNLQALQRNGTDAPSLETIS
jgi:hypothetical protein